MKMRPNKALHRTSHKVRRPVNADVRNKIMKRKSAIRIGGWLVSALVLYALWYGAATITDINGNEGTLLAKTAALFVMITIWPMIYVERVLGPISTFYVTLLIEGAICWEIGYLAYRLIRMAQNKKCEQGGPGYPPQGVGSPDP